MKPGSTPAKQSGIESAAVKKADPGKGCVKGRKARSSKEATGGKKCKLVDADEDDEEFLPVKQQSPKEKNVKLEAGTTPVKQQSPEEEKVKLEGR